MRNTRFKRALRIKAFIVFTALALFLPVFLFSKDYDIYVDDSASSGGDGSSGSPFDSIEDATDAADSGDEIYVKKGAYNESFTIPESVKLYGENRNEVIISGAIEMENKTHLEKVTVQKSNTTVTIKKDATAKISNCKIRDYYRIGIDAVAGGGKLTVVNSVIADGDGKGFYIQRGKHILIQNNEIYDNKEEGIDVRSKVDGEIRDNNSHDNGESGIEVIIGSSDVRIVGNKLRNNKASGIASQFYVDHSKKGKIEIKGNDISGNKKYGLDCNMPHGGKPKDSYWKDSIELENNTFKKNKIDSISSVCDLIDAVDEDEEKDNVIEEETALEEEAKEEAVAVEAETITEEEKAQQELEMRREEKINQIEELFLRQAELEINAAYGVRNMRQKDNAFKIFIFGTDPKELDELEAKIYVNQQKLDEVENLINQTDEELLAKNTFSSVLQEKKMVLSGQKKFLAQMKNDFSLFGWIRVLIHNQQKNG